jgi:hypothetical protein
VRGLFTSAYANAPGLTEIELVGLPVKRADWSGIGKHGEPQGMVGSFTDAQTAAVARLTRGAPQVGWALTDGSGIAAPTWVPPNFPSLVGEVNSSLLDQLKAIVKGFAPDQQAAQTISIAFAAAGELVGPVDGRGRQHDDTRAARDDVDGRLDGSLPEPGAGIRDRLPAGGRWSSGPRRSTRLHGDGALGTRARRQVGAGGPRRGHCGAGRRTGPHGNVT